MTTDTPRTDSATELYGERPFMISAVPVEFAERLERELAASHTENVCLKELVQEFYEWSRRDYPTESEVREIMDRYYALQNK